MEERERVKSSGGEEVAPGPGTTSKTEPDTVEDKAGNTDVCSERFDPLLALYSPDIPLPFPDIKCFNNVAEYESFLKGGRGRGKPENAEKRRRKAAKGQPDPERIERLRRLMVNNPVVRSEEGEGSGGPSQSRRKRQKPPRNVLTRMALCKGSPLAELQRCVEEKIRVRVYIRTFKGLRGVCSGFVVAFDKFWNLAMVDVDETYREPLLGEALYHEKALTVTRLFEKLKLQEQTEAEESVKKLERERSVEARPTQPKTPGRSSSSTRPTGEESEPREDVETKTKDPQRRSVSQRLGRVHSRHLNQLFIRGESVVLINPQPL